jgi:ankyrin repeat protein
MLHVLSFVTPSRLLAVGINELLVAACTGDSDKIRTLVNKEGFSPSHEFQQGVTALHEACEGGHEQCVAVLIELGAEVNQQVSYYLSTKCTVHLCVFLS